MLTPFTSSQMGKAISATAMTAAISAGGRGVAGDQQQARGVEQVANPGGDEQEAQHLGEVARLHNQVAQNQHVGDQEGDANGEADAVRVEEQRHQRVHLVRAKGGGNQRRSAVGRRSSS